MDKFLYYTLWVVAVICIAYSIEFIKSVITDPLSTGLFRLLLGILLITFTAFLTIKLEREGKKMKK